MALHQIFFFALIVFLPTQLGYHLWPEWTYVLGRRVDYLSPTFYLTDILIALLLFSWISEQFKSTKGLVSGMTDFISKILNFKYVILFILLNILFAKSQPVAIYKWLKVLEFAGLSWYIIKTKPKLFHVTISLSVGVLYSSLLATSQFFLQHSVGGLLWFLGERTFTVDTPGIARLGWCLIPGAWCRELLRPYATFPHPNVLGGYLAVALPLLINFQIQHKQRKNEAPLKLFIWAAIGSGLLALFLTFSRSAWVVGVVASVMTIVRIQRYELKIKDRIIKSFMVFGFVAGIILFLLIMLQYSNEESVVIRQELNAGAIQMWQSSPLLGVGLGNFLVELPRVMPSRNIYFLQPVHNIYLLILTETGIVGLGSLLIFIWHIYKKKTFSIWHLLFGILFILGLVDHYMLTIQQGQLLVALLLGLMVANSDHRRDHVS